MAVEWKVAVRTIFLSGKAFSSNISLPTPANVDSCIACSSAPGSGRIVLTHYGSTSVVVAGGIRVGTSIVTGLPGLGLVRLATANVGGISRFERYGGEWVGELYVV